MIKKKQEEMYKKILSGSLKSFLKNLTENIVDKLIFIRYPRKGELIERIKKLIQNQGDAIITKIVAKPVFNSAIQAIVGGYFDENMAEEIYKELIDSLIAVLKQEFLEVISVTKKGK